MKKNMLVHLRISSENVVLYMLETVSYVLFDGFIRFILTFYLTA